MVKFYSALVLLFVSQAIAKVSDESDKQGIQLLRGSEGGARVLESDFRCGEYSVAMKKRLICLMLLRILISIFVLSICRPL